MIYWETDNHYKKRTNKQLRHDAPVVGYHEGYEQYSCIETYEDAMLWANRIVIVDAEHGIPPDDYNYEFMEG